MDIGKKSSLINRFLRAKASRGYIQQKLAKITLPDYTTFSIFAVIIGAIAGLASVFFHNSIEFFNQVFFEQTAEGLFFLGAAAVIVLPAIGMLIQSLMIKITPDIAEKKGVLEVIKSVVLRGGYIPLRTTIFHFLAPVICIGSGGTVGPEGPAAQLGGGVSSKLCQLVGLSDTRRRVFTAAGSGAAIAAIFNTPLGGVFFALEVILLNDFNAPTLSALILASVTASAISRIFLGTESVFAFGTPDIGGYNYIYMYAVLGILAGLISILFIRYSSSTGRIFRKKILNKGVPQWLVMITVGLLVGVSGFYFKDIFGIGYSGINHILAGKLVWKVVLILFLLKFLLVPLILNSGGFGGVFAPSLFMGACLGFLYVTLVNYLFGISLDTTTYILVGMGAMLGGINTIPITAIMIIFEMTQEYSFILPLMLAVIISTTISRLVLKGSVHVKHLEEQGYQITEGRESNILKSIFIKDVKLDQIELVPETTKLPVLIEKMIQSPSNSFYTVNDKIQITGTITETELRPIMTEYENVKDFLIASDVANPQVIFLKQTDDLDYVSRLFGKLNVDNIPVIEEETKKILGAINRQEILSIYNRESLKVNLADGLSKELKTIRETSSSAVTAGYSITEIVAPVEFIGQSLSELKIRSDYGLEVLMIKHPKEIFDDSNEKDLIITTDPDYRLRREDRLVLFGRDENIESFKKI
ncbi:MAG: chloride channel protein [Ignavibacteriaceae bacterium]